LGQVLTQRKQIEERLDMVARKSAHRVKNILTIMRIISENTLRSAPASPCTNGSPTP
jgi:hypothetical protein